MKLGLGLGLRQWSYWSGTPAPQNAESSNSNPPARSTTKNVSLDNYNDIFCFLADFGVLVCKQHCSGVVNLNKHLAEQHATPA
jgi:hypothetical protein